MLSHARLHQLNSSPGDNKSSKWFTTVRSRAVGPESIFSDDGESLAHTATRYASLALDKEPDGINPASEEKKRGSRESMGTTIISHRDHTPPTHSHTHPHTHTMARRMSGVMSTISKREASFTTCYANPLYDTQALWKHTGDSHDDFPCSALPVELDTHLRKALDRYSRLVGCSFDYKRSATPKDFLTMVTNERLRHMPEKGSRLDKTLKKAEAFASKFDRIMAALRLVEVPTHESSALVISSCRTLLLLAGKHAAGIERIFTVLDEAVGVMVRMAKKLSADHSHGGSSARGIASIFQAAMAMIVDIVVDITASFGAHKSSASEKAVIAQFEAQFKIIATRLAQLEFEFHMQLLHRCVEHSGSSEALFLILRGFEEHSFETCPPSYIHILIKACLSLQEHSEDVVSLRWFRLLWASIERHRHDCGISTEQWFEVYQEYLVILGIHHEHTERLHLAEEFRALVLAEFGARHIFYVRTSIELAKILEADAARYTEAVCIYEELCQADCHSFGGGEHGHDHSAIMALIELAKYRLTVLFESHVELSHRAETLLIDSYLALCHQHCYSDAKVIAALTRVVEHFCKQEGTNGHHHHHHHHHNHREGLIKVVRVLEEFIIGLLVEQRDESTLFDMARTLAKMYRDLASVELGIKFIQMIKEQVVTGEKTTVTEGHCSFAHGQLSQLDRRCFIFIHAFEQLLCGYEQDKMLDVIIRDVFTETCLYEAWYVSVSRSNRPIHVRLGAGARLVVFLEKKGRTRETRRLRDEMWEMFKGFFPCSVASDALWRLFELSVANVNERAVSIALAEHLVDVSLDVFKGRDFKAALQLLQWAQVYFAQLAKTHHGKAVELAFRISETFSRRLQTDGDKMLLELQRVSSEILVEVLRVGHMDVDFGTIHISQLNVIIRLLGERRNFTMLERILQYLWDTRMARSWDGAATVATGRRLCEVKFAAGHSSAAIALLESICYNLRDVYGATHRLTVDCETLRASFHNTCGDHRAARDIHVHLLEQVGCMGQDEIADSEDVADLVLDQARRLKYACNQRGTGSADDKDESLLASLVKNAQQSLHGTHHHHQRLTEELQDTLALAGERRETKWSEPNDWSLPLGRHVEGEL